MSEGFAGNYSFLNIAGTPSVQEAQHANGSGNYWAAFKGDRTFDRFTDSERQFIAARDSFYMATVSETGWPYVQHRGGPPGFIRVLDDKTLAIADFRGNRQYITLGNHRCEPRFAVPDGLSEPAAAEDLRSCRSENPRRQSRACASSGDARLQGVAGTRAAVPSRRLRLELPATHHAALYRRGGRGGAGCRCASA
jgi:hypothetical protein